MGGSHTDANGIYTSSATKWEGHPVYHHSELDPPLVLFYLNSYWVLAHDVCNMPRAIARWGPCAAGSPHPEPSPQNGSSQYHCKAQWEFLQDESQKGYMVTTQTRTYVPDRSIQFRIISPNGRHTSHSDTFEDLSSERGVTASAEAVRQSIESKQL